MFGFITTCLGFFDFNCFYGLIFWSFVGLALIGAIIRPIFHTEV